MKLLIYPAVESERLEKIRQAAGEMTVVNADDLPTAQREIADADGFYGKMTPSLLAAAKQLRWVQSPTASLEHYVFPELIEHPCVLTNMRGLYSDVIADHVFGFILCFARNIHRYIRLQTRSEWKPIGGEHSDAWHLTGPCAVSPLDRAHRHVSDDTLGIVGFGHIGREIARRGLAFGMRVIAVDPVPENKPVGVDQLWDVDHLPQLLNESDFVVIAAPHTPETEGMFAEAQFRQMKRTAYLVNIGRGVIVRLDDLVAALEQGEIAGAGLDVFEIEPLPPDHPLWGMENVIITPHVAAASVHLAERHLALLLDNISRFARSEPLRNITDKRRWF